MFTVWLCLVHKSVVLSNEETHRPSSEMFVKVIFHCIHCQRHHVVCIRYKLTSNLTPFSHLGGLTVKQDIVAHGPFILCMGLGDVNGQETNFIFELHEKGVEIFDKLVKRGSGV